MHLERIISVVAVVVLVIIVLVVVVMVTRRRCAKPAHKTRDESDSRISVSAPRGESRYRVTKGKLLEEQSAEVAPQPKIEVQAPAPEHEFPRNLALAGNKMNDYLPKNETPRVAVNASRTVQSKQELADVETDHDSDQEVNQSEEQIEEVVAKSDRRTVRVARVADLFSPQENIEEELGVDAVELDKMVKAYKKKTEYKERRLPVNAHFNIDDYKESKNVMRESAVNAASSRGSKRGQITAQIYKKHGKNFTVQREEVNGSNMSVGDDEEVHEAPQKLVRNHGKLVVH